MKLSTTFLFVFISLIAAIIMINPVLAQVNIGTLSNDTRGVIIEHPSSPPFTNVSTQTVNDTIFWGGRLNESEIFFDELGDTKFSGLSNEDIAFFNSTSGKWENRAATSITTDFDKTNIAFVNNTNNFTVEQIFEDEIQFRNGSFFFYNETNGTLMLFVNNELQQTWGSSSHFFTSLTVNDNLTVQGGTNLEGLLSFTNVTGDTVVLDANLNATIINAESLREKNTFVCLQNGTHCPNLSQITNASFIPTDIINQTTGTFLVGQLLNDIIDTLFQMILDVNTTSNIEILGFVTGSHTVDTNASTACTSDEVLLGNGSCISTAIFKKDDGDWNRTGNNLFTAKLEDSVAIGGISTNGKFEVFTDSFIIGDSNTTTGVNASGYYRYEEGQGSLAFDSAGDKNGTHFRSPTYIGSKGGSDTGAFSIKYNGIDEFTETTSGNIIAIALIGGDTDTVAWGAWVNFSQTETDIKKIIYKYDEGENKGFYLDLQSDDKPECGFESATINADTELTENVWHHVVCVVTPENPTTNFLRVYIDGVLDKETTFTEPADNTNDKDFFIATEDAVSNFFNGSLDNIFVVDYSLSSADVLDIFNNGFAGTNITFNLTKNVNSLYVDGRGVGIGTTEPTHELNIIGDLNVTGTIFFQSLQAQSPHLFEPDAKIGYTRQCWMNMQGKWNMVYFTRGQMVVEENHPDCSTKYNKITIDRSNKGDCRNNGGKWDVKTKICR